MASKKNTYKPAAIDADGDGIVQEGTEFERPVGTELEIIPAEETETEDTPAESSESLVEATTPAEGVKVYVAREGDTYASVAGQFLPEGMKKHDYAVFLLELNKNARLVDGTEVKLG